MTKKLKPNKKYSRHTDDNFLKRRDAKVNPWKFIVDNYKISTHFIERCQERKIAPKDIANTLLNGIKYYIIWEHKTEIRYVSERHGVVECNGVLATAIYFGKNEYNKLIFVQEFDNFVFTEK